MGSPHSLSSLELLEPETQALILCHISTAKALHSLISASPRFYQVFKSRREYHLTQLAKQQCGYSPSAWTAITASKLPRPLSVSAADKFIDTFLDDDGWEVTIMPLDVSIPMIRLGRSLEWFIPDFARDSLRNLTHLKSLMGLQQDGLVLHSELSKVETSRIRRAFSRFELSTHICKLKSDDISRLEFEDQNKRFLLQLEPDEIEEIASVRDYMIRRLWAIFDQIEDDLVQGAQAGQVPKVFQAMQLLPDSENWFGVHAKEKHMDIMEHMLFRGLSFLQDVFTADKERCVELVFLASAETAESSDESLTETLKWLDAKDPDEAYKFRDCMVHDESMFRDRVEDPSLGWLWIKMEGTMYYPGSYVRKGPSDWGYIFWSRDRLRASGIFDV